MSDKTPENDPATDTKFPAAQDPPPETSPPDEVNPTTSNRRTFLRSCALSIGKYTTYAGGGAVTLEGSNAGNWHNNTPESVGARRTIGALTGVAVGKFIERENRKKEEHER